MPALTLEQIESICLFLSSILTLMHALIFISPRYLIIIEENRITTYFILKIVGRSNEHMFRFTGVDLICIIHLHLFSRSLFTFFTRSQQSLEEAKIPCHQNKGKELSGSTNQTYRSYIIEIVKDQGWTPVELYMLFFLGSLTVCETLLHPCNKLHAMQEPPMQVIQFKIIPIWD